MKRNKFFFHINFKILNSIIFTSHLSHTKHKCLYELDYKYYIYTKNAWQMYYTDPYYRVQMSRVSKNDLRRKKKRNPTDYTLKWKLWIFNNAVKLVGYHNFLYNFFCSFCVSPSIEHCFRLYAVRFTFKWEIYSSSELCLCKEIKH